MGDEPIQTKQVKHKNFLKENTMEMNKISVFIIDCKTL